jgi:hypothetical protein
MNGVEGASEDSYFFHCCGKFFLFWKEIMGNFLYSFGERNYGKLWEIFYILLGKEIMGNYGKLFLFR